MVTFNLLFIVAIVKSYELVKVDRSLMKGGLHRDLVTNVTFSIDSQQELDECSFIFRETVSKDSYVYLEEVNVLKSFDFWPHYPIDIEKPASVSVDHQIMWRLPFSDATH